MDAGLIVGFIAIGLLGIGNILTVAFTFGKLKQKVDDLCSRVSRLEVIQDSRDRNSRQRVEAKSN